MKKRRRLRSVRDGRLTPVGSIGLHSQFVRSVVSVATQKAKLVEHFLCLGVHVVSEILNINKDRMRLVCGHKKIQHLIIHFDNKVNAPYRIGSFTHEFPSTHRIESNSGHSFQSSISIKNTTTCLISNNFFKVQLRLVGELRPNARLILLQCVTR